MSEELVELHDEDFHSYTFITPKGQQVARFEVDNVYTDRGAVWGEVTVWYLFDGEPGRPTVAHKRVNLLTDKRPGIDDLADQAEMWRWDVWYEAVTNRTVTAHRAPPKLHKLTPSDIEEMTAPFLIEPFVLYRGVSLLFGPGGTGKSMLALAAALSVASDRSVMGRRPVATGNVIYLDYEDTQQTHRVRLRALLDGLGMTEEDLVHDIMWVKPPSSISRMRRQLRQYEREISPAMVIVDSVGLARGGDAMGSEETIRLFNTLGALDSSVLCIDHMTKEDRRSGKMVTPYGSVYTENSVRLAWAMKAADASNDEAQYINLTQTKRNNVSAHPPLGLEVNFENEPVIFNESLQHVLRSVKVKQTDQWWEADEGSTIDRITDWLDMNTKGTITEIAKSLSLKPGTVQKALERHEPDAVQRLTSSKPYVWGLS